MTEIKATDVVNFFRVKCCKVAYFSLKSITIDYLVERFNFGKHFSINTLNENELKMFNKVKSIAKYQAKMLVDEGFLEKTSSRAYHVIKKLEGIDTPEEKTMIINKWKSGVHPDIVILDDMQAENTK